MTKKKFLYNLSRASYQKNWGKRLPAAHLSAKDFSRSWFVFFPNSGRSRCCNSKPLHPRRNECSKPALTRPWIATDGC